MSQWYILPGLGADATMFQELAKTLSFQINFIEWPAFRGEKSFSQVAERVIAEYHITSEDVIGGASLGGMVALEIAQILHSRTLVLIGSALQRSEINSLLLRCSPLARFAPIKFTQKLLGINKHPLAQMIAESDPDFIRAMSLHVPAWAGYLGAQNIVHRVHGRRDLMIRCPKTNYSVIEGAGHVPSMTHPLDCAAFLEDVKRNIEIGGHDAGANVK